MPEHKRNTARFSMTMAWELFKRIEKARMVTEGQVSRSEYICNMLQKTVPK